MYEIDITNRIEWDAKISEGQNHSGKKQILFILLCLFLSLMASYCINDSYGSYLPIMLIAIYEWYRSYPRKKRSYYGLCRLLLYIFVIGLWVVFILRISIQNIALLFGYHHIGIEKVQHLFPYALIFTMFARSKPDMDLNDKRRYIIHLLYDVPAFLLVLIFKLLNHPLNSLYSQVTDGCYLGCLPTTSDVKTLNDIGIRRVINMCAEYNGPCRTYKNYNIKQLHLPTIDGTAPSLKTIQKAINFMNEAGKNNEKVFVHCKVGMGRSATIVFCHLVANERISPKHALKLMKEKRPEITTSIVTYVPVKQFLILLKRNKAE